MFAFVFDLKDPYDDFLIMTKVSLKEFQNKLLRQCIRLETENIEICKDNTIQTKIGILCSNVGTGKSFIILSLICEKHKLVYEQIVNYISTVSLNMKKGLLETNIIVINNILIHQWSSYIEKFKLKYVCIQKDTEISYILLNVHLYDVILVTCTCYNTFAQMSENKSLIYKRSFYDDVDSLNITRSIDLKTAFKWFITSSLNNLSKPFGQQVYIENVSRYINFISGIKSTGYIRDIFSSLSNHPNILRYITSTIECNIEKEFSIPDYKENLIICKTPILLYILESTLTNEIVKCINANDITSALQLINPNNKLSEDNIISACISRLSSRLYNLNNQIENANETSTKKKKIIIENLNNNRQNVKNQISNISDRIRQTNICPICYDNIYNEKTIMNGCCSNAFCFKCIFKWIAINKSCPLCKENINLGDIMVVDNNIPNYYALEYDTSMQIHENNDKICNLANIIKSGDNKKILLFSEFDKTFENVIELFKNDKHVSTFFLKGKLKNKIEKFISNKHTSVLFMNHNYNGCGLNLNDATDIIFFHKFDSEIEKQIIGRAQRYGRKSQLNIWYLLHTNELILKESNH